MRSGLRSSSVHTAAPRNASPTIPASSDTFDLCAKYRPLREPVLEFISEAVTTKTSAWFGSIMWRSIDAYAVEKSRRAPARQIATDGSVAGVRTESPIVTSYSGRDRGPGRVNEPFLSRIRYRSLGPLPGSCDCVEMGLRHCGDAKKGQGRF